MRPKLSTNRIDSLRTAALFLVFFVPFSTARAQNPEAESGAQSLLIDPSIRASAMGHSSNAVFWGSGANYWSNPALLAYRRGVEYEWGRTQLVPDLADDVFFTTKRLTLGYWGVGFLVAGRPISKVGGLRLDYGLSIATDVDGNYLGSFTSYEDIQSFATGVNLLEFAEHALKWGGMEIPTLTRFGDIAIGWSEKRTHVSLAPAEFTVDRIAGEGDVTTHDSGVLVRLTPYDGIDHPGLVPALDQVLGTRLDASYGGSTQNYNNATISYVDPDQADPVARIQIKGWAAHAAFDLPRWRKETIRAHRLGWLIDVVSPLISVGKAGSKQVPMVPDAATGGLRSGTRIENSGWEITVANIYSFRGGKVDDPAGTVQGRSSGWGIALHLKDIAGLSYDKATVPQSIYLGDVQRKALTFYFNPLRAWDLIRSGRRSA